MKTDFDPSDHLQEIRSALFSMADEGYNAFTVKLIPNIPASKVIGVRAPVLRAYEKSIRNSREAKTFLGSLPHAYLDEDNLHALLINSCRNFDTASELAHEFLPFVDNWATCDSISPRVFAKNKEKLLCMIGKWIESEHTYTVRFAIRMLMTHFLEDDFSPDHPERVARVSSDEYYLMMMKAWYFATALAYRYDSILPYLEEHRLDKRTHNKTIQKAIESYRIDGKAKEYLRTLRRRK